MALGVSFKIISVKLQSGLYLHELQQALARRMGRAQRNPSAPPAQRWWVSLRSTHRTIPSRRPPHTRHRSLPPHFRLLELRRGNRPVERGAQFLRRLQRQLDPGARAGL